MSRWNELLDSFKNFIMGIRKRILLISSANPLKGPGAIGMDLYNAFKEADCEVDFLTLYQVDSRPDIKYVYKKPAKWQNLSFKIRRKFAPKPVGDYCFFYGKENCPPVRVSKVLKSVGTSYDLVFVFFWQELLSFQTIDKLYDKLQCTFVFYCADYSPMSGGCHFTGDCRRFETGCGCCPAFGSTDPNDFTHWNVKYRKKVYEKVKPVLLANTYMLDSFMKKSFLLKDQRLEFASTLLDLDKFRLLKRDKELYRHFDIPLEKKYILSFGCQSLTDERKGMSYLLDALDIAYEQMTLEERKQVLLLFAGKNGEQIEPRLKFDYKNLGFISVPDLPLFYSVSTMFLCASVNDAGPSMLCQSIACGTPLVAFEMGTALDVLKGHNTGYCAKLRNSEDLARGILYVMRLDSSAYRDMRMECRSVAENLNSKEVLVTRILNYID